MKRYLIISAAVAVFCAATGFAIAHARAPRLQGSEPYTPTKLEWLAVELNGNYRHENPLSSYHIFFDTFPNEDAIVIVAIHNPDVDRRSMNSRIAQCRAAVTRMAKRYGWDWVQIREDVRQTK